MLNFDQIKEYFEDSLARLNPKGMLVEYLQYECLDSLFKNTGSEKLSFIGGTAIRIIHDSRRFSEDLDFDNFGLNFRDFKALMNKACLELKVKGFEIEERSLEKGKNYHCYIKFPNILFKLGISSHKDEKIFLSIDVEQKKKLFIPEAVPINKFGVFRNIIVDPASVLLSQKLLAILFRKREKGRDFYDASFLAGKTKPDYDYIKKVADLGKEEFVKKLIKRCEQLNFKDLSIDAEPFLFDQDQLDRVLKFKESLPAIL